MLIINPNTMNMRSFFARNILVAVSFIACVAIEKSFYAIHEMVACLASVNVVVAIGVGLHFELIASVSSAEFWKCTLSSARLWSVARSRLAK